MNGAQKFSLSLLISVVLFVVAAVLFYPGDNVVHYTGVLADRVERLYSQRVEGSVEQDLASISATVADFHSANIERFSTVFNLPVFLNAYQTNSSESQIAARDAAIEEILSRESAFSFVRLIDIVGSEIHYSSLDEDRNQQIQAAGRLVYLRPSFVDADTQGAAVVDDASMLRPPLQRDWINDFASRDPGIYTDPIRNLFVYRIPVADADGILGNALVYVSTRSLQRALLADFQIEIGDAVRVLDRAVAVNVPTGLGSAIVDELRQRAGAIVSSTQRYLLESDEASETSFSFSTFTDEPGFGISVIYLVPTDALRLPQVLVYTMLGAILLTAFLVVFMLLNVRQDAVVVLADRVKRLQVSLLREYVDQRSDRSFPELRTELKARGDEVAREIKRGLGRIRKSQEEEINRLIQSGWNEILDVLAARAEPQKTGQIDMERLEAVVRQLVASTAQRRDEPRPARTVPGTAPVPVEVEEVEALDSDVEDIGDLEEAEQLGEPMAVEASDVVGMAAEEAEVGVPFGKPAIAEQPEDGLKAPTPLGTPVEVEEIFEAEDLEGVSSVEEVEEIEEVAEPMEADGSANLEVGDLDSHAGAETVAVATGDLVDVSALGTPVEVEEYTEDEEGVEVLDLVEDLEEMPAESVPEARAEVEPVKAEPAEVEPAEAVAAELIDAEPVDTEPIEVLDAEPLAAEAAAETVMEFGETHPAEVQRTEAPARAVRVELADVTEAADVFTGDHLDEAAELDWIAQTYVADLPGPVFATVDDETLLHGQAAFEERTEDLERADSHGQTGDHGLIETPTVARQRGPAALAEEAAEDSVEELEVLEATPEQAGELAAVGVTAAAAHQKHGREASPSGRPSEAEAEFLSPVIDEESEGPVAELESARQISFSLTGSQAFTGRSSSVGRRGRTSRRRISDQEREMSKVLPPDDENDAEPAELLEELDEFEELVESDIGRGGQVEELEAVDDVSAPGDDEEAVELVAELEEEEPDEQDFEAQLEEVDMAELDELASASSGRDGLEALEEIDEADEVEEAEEIEEIEEARAVDEAEELGGGVAVVRPGHTGSISFRSVVEPVTSAYEISSVADILARFELSARVVVDSDGLIEIDRDAYSEPQSGDREIKDLVDSVVGEGADQTTSGVEMLFGDEPVELLPELDGAAERDSGPSYTGVSAFRFSVRGFDYDAFLRGYKRNDSGVMKSLVRFTRHWGARTGILYIRTERGLKAEYTLGISQECRQSMLITEASSIYRNVLSKRSVLFVNAPLQQIDDFKGRCGVHELGLFERVLFVPVTVTGQESYALLGLSEDVGSLEEAFRTVVPQLDRGDST